METQQPIIHKCGLCNASFPTEEAYTTHTCEKTGLVPTHPDHFGEEYKAISEGALLRGNLKQQLIEAGYPVSQAEVLSGNVTTQEQSDTILRSFITNKQSNA